MIIGHPFYFRMPFWLELGWSTPWRFLFPTQPALVVTFLGGGDEVVSGCFGLSSVCGRPDVSRLSPHSSGRSTFLSCCSACFAPCLALGLSSTLSRPVLPHAWTGLLKSLRPQQWVFNDTIVHMSVHVEERVLIRFTFVYRWHLQSESTLPEDLQGLGAHCRFSRTRRHHRLGVLGSFYPRPEMNWGRFAKGFAP